jgi:hypothetical protein
MFSDRNTESDLIFLCHGNRIHLTVTAEALQKSPSVQSRYLHFLKVAEEYELDGLTVEDFYDWILKGCAQEFHRLPPNVPEHPTLEDFFHPPTWYYELSASEDDSFVLTKVDGPEDFIPPGSELFDELFAPWASFAPSQVHIVCDLPEMALAKTPKKVGTSEGGIHYFKLFDRSDAMMARRELEKYSQIEKAKLDGLPTSRLNGIVRDPGGTFHGLLLTYIDADAQTLLCAVNEDTSNLLRQRWSDQVSSALKHLHEAGIVWGDAKPDNVLIDSQDDAWLIDFGGGYTEGWVDKELAETMEGDLQGLARIKEYIFEVFEE